MFSGSFVRALLYAFPDIGLERNKLHNMSRMSNNDRRGTGKEIIYFVAIGNFWSIWHNRREYFVAYAEENNFDPLVPDNWYLQLESVKNYKVYYISF